MELASYWQASARRLVPPQTEFQREYDVAIVGGGFTGLSAARRLARAGKKVALLEGGQLGNGASGRNGGHLNNGLAHGYGAAMARFGPERARALYHAYDAAIDLIEEIIAEESIACDFRRAGKLKFAARPGHVAGLRAAFELIHREADKDTAFLDRAELAGEIATDQAHGAMLYRKSAMMHMGRYLSGLAAACLRHGADLFEACPALNWRHDAGAWQLTTPRGTLCARDLILATGGYSGAFAPGPLRHFRRRIVPVGSFIIATRPLSDAEIAATVPGNRTYVNTLNIGSYFRLSPDNRLIFGGRARFSAKTDARIDAACAVILRRTMERMFPALQGVALEYCFGGLVDMTQDRLPRAGRIDGAHYAMGYSGHGAQMSNLMGVVLADMILGQGRNPLDHLDWPAIPGHFGTPWFLPATGLYYRLKDLLG